MPWLVDCSTYLNKDYVFKTTLSEDHHSLTLTLTDLQTKTLETRKKQIFMLDYRREMKFSFNHKIHQRILVTSQDETVWVLKFGHIPSNFKIIKLYLNYLDLGQRRVFLSHKDFENFVPFNLWLISLLSFEQCQLHQVSMLYPNNQHLSFDCIKDSDFFYPCPAWMCSCPPLFSVFSRMCMKFMYYCMVFRISWNSSMVKRKRVPAPGEGISIEE